nr:PREDICTED: uncharacterized protein LOC109029916 [Bemisia tabaci]
MEYLYAIRRGDPCKKLGLCANCDDPRTQAEINADAACKYALDIWDRLSTSRTVRCLNAEVAKCRKATEKSRRCYPHKWHLECSFRCTRENQSTFKFLSELVDLPED